MKRVRYYAATIVAACLLFLSLNVGSVSARGLVVPYTNSCEAADNLRWVPGDRHCFAIRTFMPAKMVARPILRIYIHGDYRRGGPVDGMYNYALRTPSGVVSVAMLRPGNWDFEGRQSSEKSYGSIGDETAEDLDEFAAAVRRLKGHHNASRVILIGQSGGANISAVMLGRHPGVADGALLAGCACDKVAKAMHRNRRVRDEDLSPIDYVDKIPLNARIVALTGSRDNTNPASICGPYFARLKERGISARLEIVEGAKHSFRRLARSDAYQDGLVELEKE